MADADKPVHGRFASCLPTHDTTTTNALPTTLHAITILWHDGSNDDATVDAPDVPDDAAGNPADAADDSTTHDVALEPDASTAIVSAAIPVPINIPVAGKPASVLATGHAKS